MCDATQLRPGAELNDLSNDETLTVVENDGDTITWEVEGEYSETFDYEEVQAAFEYGELEVVSEGGDKSDEGDEGREPEEISDIDVDDVDADDLYIRFGNLPEGGRSYDNRNDRLEDGVSVYACEEEDGVYHPAGNLIQQVLVLMLRDTYLVTGDQVGTGADGEPVLEDVEVVAKLRSPKGVSGWIVGEE